MTSKPCTLGKRHKWVWFKNVETRSMTTHSIRIARKSKYRCECGATKIGPLDPNHSGE